MRKFFLATIFFTGPLIFSSCTTDDDFAIPELAITREIHMETNTDLDALLGAFYQSKKDLVTFDQDLVIEAFVVSSDEAGNFYKVLVVQDKPENPTAGIAVQINQVSYFESFDFGRKIYLKLKGLSMSEKNGVVALGLANGKQIDQIPRARIQDHIIRTAETSGIIPLKVKAAEFHDRLENLYVQLRDVQFSRFHTDLDNPFTYASEDNDEYDGERLVESCVGDFPFILSTSTYADFKAFRLPQTSGKINGILTRDYYDKFFTVYLNGPADVVFDDEARCDPKSLDCGLASKEGRKILFSEEFTGTNNKPVSGNGWTNYIQEGSRGWEVFTATGTNASLGKSARVRPSGSGDHLTISWLITPQIAFDAHSGAVFNFKTSTSFANNSIMEVLFSNDWDGTVENLHRANWKNLTAAYIARKTDFFGDWISSGHVDLSCAEGAGFVAFRYTGNDTPHYNGIYELDDIYITAD